MRNPRLDSVVGRIARLERDVRNLRLREGNRQPEDIIDLAARLYSTGGEQFVASDSFGVGYYIDRGRCYLTGGAQWQGGTSSDTALFLFADNEIAMDSRAKPHHLGWTRIHIPYDWQNSDTVFLPDGGDPASAQGAFVEALVIGDVFTDSVYIEFKDTILPFPDPIGGATAVKTNTSYAKQMIGAVDQGYLVFEGISWRVA